MEPFSIASPVWIDQPEDLLSLAQRMSAEPVVAVDTESNSLFAYQERVCLVQFSVDHADYLVDPIALPDLVELGDIFASERIEKIFHAAEYDLICLKRDFGFDFNNIFDTMQAGRILGREGLGLAAMLEAEFGLKLEKRYQRANWGQRPLTQEMIAYAALDTHYLFALRDRLKTALLEAGRWELACEDFRRLCAVGIPQNDREEFWRLPGSRDLTPQQYTVLKALCEFREQQAQKADMPLFKVLSNQTLVETAAMCPLTRPELEGIPGLSPSLLRRYGDGLLRAVQRGMKEPPAPRTRNHRPDEKFLDRLERMKQWRKLKARELGVESDVILPREEMEQIARLSPATGSEIAAILQHLPWRLEHYGEEIGAVVKA